MEILIVVGIIVLVVSVAFPLFQALRGSRSTEAAQNVVSAALGYARTRAINDGRSHGVLFFVDPATESTRLWIVRRGYETTDDPDPLERYKGWYPQSWTGNGEKYFAPDDDSVPFQVGDRTVSISRDFYIGQFYENSQSGPLVKLAGKPLVRNWQTREYESTSAYSHTPQLGSAGNPAPPGTEQSTITDTTSTASADSTMINANWERVRTNRISRVEELEELRLPPGTGVQLMIDPGNTTDADRYVRTGVVMFDSQGRLSFDSFVITKDSQAGKVMGLTADTIALTPAFGLVAYDQIEFKRNPSFSENDYVYPNSGIDLLLKSPYFVRPADNPVYGYVNNEKPEETWLDENSVPILINRYSGSLSLTE